MKFHFCGENICKSCLFCIT